jgi:hypothetical protein
MGYVWASEEEGPTSFQREWRKEGAHQSKSPGIGDHLASHMGIAIRGDPHFSPSSQKWMHQLFSNC